MNREPDKYYKKEQIKFKELTKGKSFRNLFKKI